MRVPLQRDETETDTFSLSRVDIPGARLELGPDGVLGAVVARLLRVFSRGVGLAGGAVVAHLLPAYDSCAGEDGPVDAVRLHRLTQETGVLHVPHSRCTLAILVFPGARTLPAHPLVQRLPSFVAQDTARLEQFLSDRGTPLDASPHLHVVQERPTRAGLCVILAFGPGFLAHQLLEEVMSG